MKEIPWYIKIETKKKKLSPSPHCPVLLAGPEQNVVVEEVVTTTGGEEDMEAQDSLTREEDVVNCVCQINEEYDRMIQVSPCVKGRRSLCVIWGGWERGIALCNLCVCVCVCIEWDGSCCSDIYIYIICIILEGRKNLVSKSTRSHMEQAFMLFYLNLCAVCLQCDSCLCWQHTKCMGITDIPAKHTCHVCPNPPGKFHSLYLACPTNRCWCKYHNTSSAISYYIIVYLTGVRESAKYQYDQDWLRQGRMARFGFLGEDPMSERKANIMQQTNNLVSDLHECNAVLRSNDCLIHALNK